MGIPEYKKLSLTICDSLFELIPNISSKIFSKRLHPTSVNGVPNISSIQDPAGILHEL